MVSSNISHGYPDILLLCLCGHFLRYQLIDQESPFICGFVALFLINGNPERRTRGALYLAGFHVLLLLFFWSFWTTVLTDPGLPASVPDLVVTPPILYEYSHVYLVVITNTGRRGHRARSRRRQNLATELVCPLLHHMPIRQTRPLSSLLRLQAMRPQNGSSLHVAQQLRRSFQLQTIHRDTLLCSFVGSLHEHNRVPAARV